MSPTRYRCAKSLIVNVTALVAQWIAHWTSNPEVAGSSPVKSVFIDSIVYKLELYTYFYPCTTHGIQIIHMM